MLDSDNVFFLFLPYNQCSKTFLWGSHDTVLQYNVHVRCCIKISLFIHQLQPWQTALDHYSCFTKLHWDIKEEVFSWYNPQPKVLHQTSRRWNVIDHAGSKGMMLHRVQWWCTLHQSIYTYCDLRMSLLKMDDTVMWLSHVTPFSLHLVWNWTPTARLYIRCIYVCECYNTATCIIWYIAGASTNMATVQILLDLQEKETCRFVLDDNAVCCLLFLQSWGGGAP